MKWIEARVEFDAPDTDLALELISNIFFEMGLTGVAVEDPDIESTEDWAEGPEKKIDRPAVVGYIPEDHRLESRRRILESELARLSKQAGIRLNTVYGETAEEDWAESWKRFFKPQKVTGRLVVKPSWEQYAAGPEEIVLEIDPGMAFGTGTHPTTCLCLELIEKYLRPGDTFLDIGTGSGILMIAAAKLGASTLTGIDIDPNAVGVAQKNLVRNGIPGDRFCVRTGHLTRGLERCFTIVAANILTEVILTVVNALKSVLARQGIFIFSGITRQNLERVMEAIEKKGFRVIQVGTKEEWVAVAGTYSQFQRKCGKDS